MAHRFIVGETPRDALRLLRGLWHEGVAASVDLLGEATVTVEEADRYAERCRTALRDARTKHPRGGRNGRRSSATRSARSRAST